MPAAARLCPRPSPSTSARRRRRTGRSSSGLLELFPLERLAGDGGELAPGIEWGLTPGHCDGHISLAVDTAEGRVVLCGDTIGPGRAEFDAMAPSGPEAETILTSWRRIRAWDPVRVIAGHLPPFVP